MARAIGTILDPKGKAIESIKKNEAFYGDVDILGKPYTTGYEPIRDAKHQVIGIFYVGYLK
jgi:cache 3/cache 2 fusion protein